MIFFHYCIMIMKKLKKIKLNIEKFKFKDISVKI